MTPTAALWGLTFVAIVVLYLCLAAVLREVRLLRAQVARLTATSAPTGQHLRLPAGLTGGRDAVVLASDSRCPLCRVVLAALADLSPRLAEPPVVLTHEPATDWGDLPPGLRLVRDEDAWRELAHLSSPVLLSVAGNGTVRELLLPANEHEVAATLQRWGAFPDTSPPLAGPLLTASPLTGPPLTSSPEGMPR